jgi:hypothetical protein
VTTSSLRGPTVTLSHKTGREPNTEEKTVRGYHRPQNDLKSFPSVSKSRDQIAELADAGFPSSVEYAVQGGPLPVNLRRSDDEVEIPVE